MSGWSGLTLALFGWCVQIGISRGWNAVSHLDPAVIAYINLAAMFGLIVAAVACVRRCALMTGRIIARFEDR